MGRRKLLVLGSETASVKLRGVGPVPVGTPFLQKPSPESWGQKLRGQRNQKPLLPQMWTGRCLSKALQVFAQLPSRVSAAEQSADWVMTSLRSTLAYRHDVLALTAILSCPVGAALSVDELVPGDSRGAGPRLFLQWPLASTLAVGGWEAWSELWGDSPRVSGIWAWVLSGSPSQPVLASPARPAGPGSPTGHPGGGQCPGRAGPACDSAGPCGPIDPPWA